MKWRGRHQGMVPMGIDVVAGSGNMAGGRFSNHVINETIGQGWGQIFGPVDVMVSALYPVLMGLEVWMSGTY